MVVALTQVSEERVREYEALLGPQGCTDAEREFLACLPPPGPLPKGCILPFRPNTKGGGTLRIDAR
jgi:hypothetical protein